MSYHSGELITKVVVGLAAAIIVMFTAAFSYVILQAFMLSSFSLSLSTNVGAISNNFTIYGFVSIEACFVVVVAYLGYTTLRNAMRRKVIEVEVEN
jgi:hypothetical protein